MATGTFHSAAIFRMRLENSTDALTMQNRLADSQIALCNLAGTYMYSLVGVSAQGVGLCCKLTSTIVDYMLKVNTNMIYIIRLTNGEFTSATKVTLT